MKIYGSKQCPDHRKCKATLEANGIEFEFLDVTEGLPDLKKFLKYRDNEPMFDRFKSEGKVGIPFLVFEDGTMLHDWDGWYRENGITPVNAASGQAYSINGKGC
ncbi:MAG: glutaredoxin [Ruminococcus sp.]|nr:glutaredoxin [Ruminococcus sp.]